MSGAGGVTTASADDEVYSYVVIKKLNAFSKGVRRITVNATRCRLYNETKEGELRKAFALNQIQSITVDPSQTQCVVILFRTKGQKAYELKFTSNVVAKQFVEQTKTAMEDAPDFEGYLEGTKPSMFESKSARLQREAMEAEASEEMNKAIIAKRVEKAAKAKNDKIESHLDKIANHECEMSDMSVCWEVPDRLLAALQKAIRNYHPELDLPPPAVGRRLDQCRILVVGGPGTGKTALGNTLSNGMEGKRSNLMGVTLGFASHATIYNPANFVLAPHVLLQDSVGLTEESYPARTWQLLALGMLAPGCNLLKDQAPPPKQISPNEHWIEHACHSIIFVISSLSPLCNAVGEADAAAAGAGGKKKKAATAGEDDKSTLTEHILALCPHLDIEPIVFMTRCDIHDPDCINHPALMSPKIEQRCANLKKNLGVECIIPVINDSCVTGAFANEKLERIARISALYALNFVLKSKASSFFGKWRGKFMQGNFNLPNGIDMPQPKAGPPPADSHPPGTAPKQPGAYPVGVYPPAQQAGTAAYAQPQAAYPQPTAYPQQAQAPGSQYPATGPAQPSAPPAPGSQYPATAQAQPSGPPAPAFGAAAPAPPVFGAAPPAPPAAESGNLQACDDLDNPAATDGFAPLVRDVDHRVIADPTVKTALSGRTTFGEPNMVSPPMPPNPVAPTQAPAPAPGPSQTSALPTMPPLPGPQQPPPPPLAQHQEMPPIAADAAPPTMPERGHIAPDVGIPPPSGPNMPPPPPMTGGPSMPPPPPIAAANDDAGLSNNVTDTNVSVW